MASIPEIVEQIGFGPAQYVQLLLMNWTGFSAMCYLMLLMVLAKPIGESLDLSVAQRTNLVAMAGVGIMIGNFSAGPIGDAFGRRRPILGTYFSGFVLGLANSWSHSYYLSLVLLLGFGFAVGQAQPIKSALGGEIVPSERRLHSRAADFILIALGGGFAAVLVWLDDPNMRELHWHWLLGMACVPYGIGFICACFFLHESPSYLSLRCEYEKVERVLEYMRTMNGKLDLDITDYQPPPPLRRQMTLGVHAEEVEKHTDLIFGKHMWLTTLTLSVGVFTGYLNFFGANYCFLQEMPAVNLFGAPSLNLMVGQLVEIPGILCFVMLGLHIRRKSLSAIGLLGASSGIFSFVAIAMTLGQPRTGKPAIALQASFFAFKFFVTGTIMTLGTFAFEVFPTKARTLGTGVVLGFGRLGGILGPKGYGWSEAYTDSFYTFMISVVFLNVLSCGLIMSLSGDPKGKSLDDHHPEENYKPDVDEETMELYEKKLSRAWRGTMTSLRAATRFRKGSSPQHFAEKNYGATFSDLT